MELIEKSHLPQLLLRARRYIGVRPFVMSLKDVCFLLYEHLFYVSVTKIREFIETYHEICYFT